MQRFFKQIKTLRTLDDRFLSKTGEPNIFVREREGGRKAGRQGGREGAAV